MPAGVSPQLLHRRRKALAVAAELQADWSHPNADDLAQLLQRNVARWNYIAEGEAAKTQKVA